MSVCEDSFVKLVLVSLGQFSGVIGFIFILELTVAVLAVVFQSQVREWINDFFLANIRAYRDDIDLQNLIDSLQKMVIHHVCAVKYKVRKS